MKTKRVRVLDDATLEWANRIVWLVCVAVYLTVFVGGILAGGADLETMGRAVAFTLAAGVLGRKAVGVLSQASLPLEEGPSAEQAGLVGSLVDLVGSTNVGQHEETAESGPIGER